MNDTITKLQDAGWREYPDQFKKHSRNFYKRFDTPTRCAGNDDKAGMQIEIHLYEPQAPHFQTETFEVNLSGEFPDGTWVSIFQWSLRSGIEQVFALIPRMLATWEFAANFKEVK